MTSPVGEAGDDSVGEPGAIERLIERLLSLQGVLFFFIVYGAANGIVTRSVGPALALDDVKLNVVTQSLQAGYMPENPPLYEWSLIAAQQIFGPTLISFIVVKYVWLSTAGAFVYLALARTVGGRRWAAAGALSLVMFFQIGWNFHQAFTHTVALIGASALFWWALARLRPASGVADFALLGAALAAGFLSKYVFVAAAFVAFAAAFRIPAMRTAIFRPYLLLSVVVCLALSAPHLAWLAAENADVSQSAAGRLRGGDADYLDRVAEGAPTVLWGIGSYFLPFAPVVVSVFGLSAFRKPLIDGAGATAAPAFAILSRDAALAGAAGLALAVVLFGLAGLQERYAIAFLFPSIFWIVHLFAARIECSRGPVALAVAALSVSLATVGLRFVETAVAGPPFCDKCRQWTPYEALGVTLDQRGLRDATLVGFSDNTAGNLRRLFPGARVLSAHMPYYAPPLRDRAGPCVFIWSEDLAPPPPDYVVARVNPKTAFSVTGRWRHWRRADWLEAGVARRTVWRVAPMAHDPELASALCRN